MRQHPLVVKPAKRGRQNQCRISVENARIVDEVADGLRFQMTREFDDDLCASEFGSPTLVFGDLLQKLNDLTAVGRQGFVRPDAMSSENDLELGLAIGVIRK